METVFFVCAVVGGTLIVCQFLMTLVGIGGDQDGDHAGGDHGGDHDASGAEHGDGGDAAHDHQHASHSAGNWFFSMLSVRTVSAAAAFFGLSGLAARHGELDDAPTLAIAIAAGAVAFFVVGWLLSFMHKLNVDGTIRIERAIGCRGNVYLTVPGARAGLGKVHVTVVGRSMEYQALTSQQTLAVGAPIVVVGVVGPDTVDVAAAAGESK